MTEVKRAQRQQTGVKARWNLCMRCRRWYQLLMWNASAVTNYVAWTMGISSRKLPKPIVTVLYWQVILTAETKAYELWPCKSEIPVQSLSSGSCQSLVMRRLFTKKKLHERVWSFHNKEDILKTELRSHLCCLVDQHCGKGGQRSSPICVLGI